MPPTPDRTTIKAAIDALATMLRTNLVAQPPTGTKPFRQVAVGRAGLEEHPRAFLAVRLTHTQPVGVTEDDKIIKATVSMVIVTDVSGADPHGAILDKIGAVDDYLDSIADTGVIDGAEGFDDREWVFDYPKTTAGARVATATATLTFLAKVERQQNRVPAS